ERRHDRVHVRVDAALLALSLVKVSDDAPVDAADRPRIAGLEAGELPAALIADNDLVQAALEHATAGKVHFRCQLGDVRRDSRERKEHPLAGAAPLRLHEQDALEHGDRRPVGTLPDAGKVADDHGRIAGDAALTAARTDSAHHDAIGAHVA